VLALQFHRQDHHRHVSQMHPAQHRKRCFQDEITEAVTIAIAPTIAHVEQQRAMRKPPGTSTPGVPTSAGCGI
jgi:hypothetical protein